MPFGRTAPELRHTGPISPGWVGVCDTEGEPGDSMGVEAGRSLTRQSLHASGCCFGCWDGDGSAGRLPILGGCSRAQPGKHKQWVTGPCLHFPTTNQGERQVVLLRKCPDLPETAGWPGSLWSCKHAGENAHSTNSEGWQSARDAYSVPVFKLD